MPLERNSLFCKNCEPSNEEADEEGTSFLPSSMKESTISDLAVGQVAFTLPWAMFADMNERLMIVESYPAEKRRGGTTQMRIAKSNGNILVDRGSIWNEKYTPCVPCYAGVSPDQYVPVTLLPTNAFNKAVERLSKQ
ncbi:hypothetical protein GYA37_00420 [candidate division WWE3 bacterium]|uniref:Uncharacterized protein n=1 Tax=candidate division WWE3 bacterium TaxID=2053526 RepID=A0A7X9HS49_UNCKA|nr:hypothetical protein [candidate division WWE3 bacterium]